MHGEGDHGVECGGDLRKVVSRVSTCVTNTNAKIPSGTSHNIRDFTKCYFKL